MMAASTHARPRKGSYCPGVVGFVMVGIMGCQVMDLQPSSSNDLPRSLPRPRGQLEIPLEEGGSGQNLSEPRSKATEGTPAIPPPSQAEAKVPQATEAIDKVALNRSADGRASGNERVGAPLRPSVSDRSIARADYLAAAIPSDPPLPTPVPSPADPLTGLYKRSYDWFQQTQSFTCRMVRREVVGGRKRPEEMMSFQYRKEPYSIHLKWLGQEGKGRELVYIEGMYDNKIQIKLAAGDIPLLPAGKRMSFHLDNPLVRSSSRHGVQEASFGFLLATVGNLISAQKQGIPSKIGTIQYVGKVQREDFGAVVEMAEVRLFPGAEEGLPQGGRRLIGFDPREGMPVLVQTFDETGQEVEYYRYDRFIMQGLDEHDFNPDELWAKPEVAGKPANANRPAQP